MIARRIGDLALASVAILASALALGCTSIATRPTSFDYPAPDVRQAAIDALRTLGFKVDKSEPLYVQGSLGAGFPKVRVRLQAVDESKAVVIVDTLTMDPRDRTWNFEVLSEMELLCAHGGARNATSAERARDLAAPQLPVEVVVPLARALRTMPSGYSYVAVDFPKYFSPELAVQVLRVGKRAGRRGKIEAYLEARLSTAFVARHWYSVSATLLSTDDRVAGRVEKEVVLGSTWVATLPKAGLLLLPIPVPERVWIWEKKIDLAVELSPEDLDGLYADQAQPKMRLVVRGTEESPQPASVR